MTGETRQSAGGRRVRRAGIGLILIGLAVACLFRFIMPERPPNPGRLREPEDAPPRAEVAGLESPAKPPATEPGSRPARAAGLSRLHGHSGPAPRSSGPASRWPDGLTPIELREVTPATGIRFQHTDGSSGRRYIVEAMSCGLATLDYDGDGRIDVYFPSGALLPGASADEPLHHHLYRNLDGWRFKDMTEQARVRCAGYGMGVAVADYDNDGCPDLYVSNFGPKVLYHNNGDGTFSDVTARAGVADGARVGAGVAFLDVDGDGLLDLFVANYVKFSYDTHTAHATMGVPSYPGPLEYRGESLALFRNQGDGRFADVSLPTGVEKHIGRGMGITCADYNNDGHTDVFICNDVQENFLVRNDGRGKFEEVALQSGVAYDVVGEPHANMGVDAGDYDNDGWLDFYVTSYQNELATLYRNGGGLFEDVTERTGAGEGTFPQVTWGCGFVDFNNDGHRDLFVVCGHTEDNVELYDRNTSYRARNLLLANTGHGTFVNVSDLCGDGLLPRHAGRGAAFEDLDNDGDIDVIALNSREGPTVLRNMLNEGGSKNHWLQVRLQGVKTNRDGVGARVRVVAGDLVQTDEVHSGRGYQSHWGSRLHFGLGKHDRIDRVEVRWIGGGADVLENLPIDRLVTIREGSGKN
jgi:hypothetical protein